MNVLLTGATGFIGTRLLQLDKWNKYTNIIRDSSTKKVINPLVINEIGPTTDWKGAFDGIDVIVHMAGVAHNNQADENSFYRVNHLATINFARQAFEAGVGRFVFVSSIGVNGQETFDKPFTENSKVAPHNAYSESKLLAEKDLLKLSEVFGKEVVIVRPPLVYGIGAKGNFDLLLALIKKIKFLPFGLVKNKRSFISVDNFCDFIMKALDARAAAGEIFLIADEESISTKRFTNEIAKALNTKIFQLPLPLGLLKILGRIIGKEKMVNQLVGNLEIDSSKAKELIGWSPHRSVIDTMNQCSSNKVKKND